MIGVSFWRPWLEVGVYVPNGFDQARVARGELKSAEWHYLCCHVCDIEKHPRRRHTLAKLVREHRHCGMVGREGFEPPRN